VANVLNIFRDAVVGFIDWLDHLTVPREKIGCAKTKYNVMMFLLAAAAGQLYCS
jgi:hypothetical protein